MSYYYYGNDNNSGGGFLSNIPKVTRNLLIINVIIFIFTLVNRHLMTSTFALFYPSSPYFHWWQVITHMFMHGGIWHILFNMYTLVIFGSVLERIIGGKKFLVFYFICGLGAVGLHLGTQHLQMLSYMEAAAEGSASAFAAINQIRLTPTVGASGAIYGVLIGYAMLFPESRMTLLFPPVTLSAKWMVAIFAAIELLTGISGWVDGVAHFAHLGGMLLGWLLILFWRRRHILFDKDRLF